MFARLRHAYRHRRKVRARVASHGILGVKLDDDEARVQLSREHIKVGVVLEVVPRSPEGEQQFLCALAPFREAFFDGGVFVYAP